MTTVSQVDQAVAAMIEAKAKARRRGGTVTEMEAYKAAASKAAKLRTEWRMQEEAAGRRAGMVTIEGEE